MSAAREPGRCAEAARWFAARRRGVMTVEERSAYSAWLRDSGNAKAMAEMEQVWSGLGAAAPYLERPAAEAATQRRAIVRSALVAAMCAVSIGIAALSYSGNPGFWTTLDWSDR